MSDKAGDHVPAWDGPTRLFHWLLVILVVLAPISQRFGGIELTWHKWNGLAIMVLILFRLLWGVVGGDSARFSGFVTGPGRAWRYLRALLRGEKPRYLGHNPVGGWMILALLSVLAAQGVFGLYTTDDVLAEGFLVGGATSETVEAASAYHARGFGLILLLVGIHVVANLGYWLLARENLVGPMITGRKPAADYVDRPRSAPGSWGRAALCLAAAGLLVAGGISLAGGTLL